MSAPRPALLCILDGWGWRTDAKDNAIAQAQTPNYTRMLAECPHALLKTSGSAVGLPQGQMGNSEVGHMNIGAGRIVVQDLPRIDMAIQDGAAGAARIDSESDAIQRRGASDGADVAGRSAFASGPYGGAGEGSGCRRAAGFRARFSGRPRHPAQERPRLRRKIPGRY